MLPPLLTAHSGPVLLLAGHKKESGPLSPISPTSSSSPSLEIVMMHTTNTVFEKIESTHLIFTLYKKETETGAGRGKRGRQDKKPLEVMYWFYANLLITNWMCLMPAQLKVKIHNKPNITIKIKQTKQKTLKEKQGPR